MLTLHSVQIKVNDNANVPKFLRKLRNLEIYQGFLQEKKISIFIKFNKIKILHR